MKNVAAINGHNVRRLTRLAGVRGTGLPIAPPASSIVSMLALAAHSAPETEIDGLES